MDTKNFTPLTPQPTITIKPQKKHSFLIVLIILILIVFFVTGAYFYLSLSKKTNQTTIKYGINPSQPQSTPINKPTSTLSTYAGVPQNNYAILKNLTPEEETKKSIVTPPKTAKEVENYKGISLIDTSSRRFKPGELDLLKKAIDKAPAKIMGAPPKAIISICCDDLKSLFIQSMTVALASGPYILVNDTFFEKGLWTSRNSENDKMIFFFHEWGHVLQYYYTFTDLINDERYDWQPRNNSSLVYDYVKAVGWGLNELKSGPKKLLFGEEIKPLTRGIFIRTWELPKENQEEWMTSNETTNPAEDMAMAIGYYINGQGQLLGSKRQHYFDKFLNTSYTQFTVGVIPIYPGSIRGSFNDEDFAKEFIQEQTNQGFQEGDKSQWFAKKEAKINEIITFFKQELTSRNFKNEKEINLTKGKHNEDYATGVYTNGIKKYLITFLDFSSATDYSYKPDQIIITVYGLYK